MPRITGPAAPARPVVVAPEDPAPQANAPRRAGPRAATWDGVHAPTVAPATISEARDLARLVEAAERAPMFLVPGNRAEDLRPMTDPVEVDPGSRAFVAQDAHGGRAWVVDQAVRIPNAAPDVLARFLHGFFAGAARGGGNGPTTEVLAVKRADGWARTAPGARFDPFADLSVEKFVARIGDVRVLKPLDGLVPPGGMDLVVERSSVRERPDQVEFTAHFLNPDRKSGPFPGTTDGAVRFRCTRHDDGSATMEGFYLTREPTQFAEHIAGFVPPMRLGRAMLSLGADLVARTPMALFGRFMEGAMHAADTAMDTAASVTHADDAVRRGVGKLHAMYYRETLFPNLAGVG
ncbi:MAG: hypothetical protein HY904_14145 [Deltaproteobacteria bacterium]|nr:hypothetical protein [Deltaproteobacteria bacterium]